jgi:hypothetical protein
MAANDPFRPGRIHHITRLWAWRAGRRLAVVPGHPLRGTALQLLGVPLQLGQIVERIDAVQFAGVDQAHEQIADRGAVQRLVEECVLAVQDGFRARSTMLLSIGAPGSLRNSVSFSQ